jgi:hypothetical protein
VTQRIANPSETALTPSKISSACNCSPHVQGVQPQYLKGPVARKSEGGGGRQYPRAAPNSFSGCWRALLPLTLAWIVLGALAWWGFSVLFPAKAQAALRLDSAYDFHCACYPTRHELIVYESTGGNIDRAIDRFADVVAEGRRINVYGYCLSSCTTALEHASTCWDAGALFGFHAGTVRSADQAHWEALQSDLGTLKMWARWPVEIRDLFGLPQNVPSKYVYFTGEFLHNLIGRGVCS